MAKLINLGSLCIDHVYRVPRIAGAGVTVASDGHDVYPGGKGLNQSIAAAYAGCRVEHIGAIGEDGQWLVDVLAQAGVGHAALAMVDGDSGSAFIQVDANGRNAIVISGGANRRWDNRQLRSLAHLAEPGDWVLLQNETNLIPECIEICADLGLQVAINLAPIDKRVVDYPLTRADLLIVNEEEACALADRTEPDAAWEALCAMFAQQALVMTAGKQGLRFRWQAPDEQGSLDAFEVESVDETAAGDAFVGYLLAGLVAGRALRTTLGEASAAGALATTRQGAAPSLPRAADVARLTSSAGV